MSYNIIDNLVVDEKVCILEERERIKHFSINLFARKEMCFCEEEQHTLSNVPEGSVIEDA